MRKPPTPDYVINLTPKHMGTEETNVGRLRTVAWLVIACAFAFAAGILYGAGLL